MSRLSGLDRSHSHALGALGFRPHGGNDARNVDGRHQVLDPTAELLFYDFSH